MNDVWPQVITGAFTVSSVAITLMITRRGTVVDRDVTYRRDVLKTVFTEFLSAALVLSGHTMDTYTSPHPLSEEARRSLDQARHRFLTEYQGSRAAIMIYAPSLSRALQEALGALDARAVNVSNETISHAEVTSPIAELDGLAQAMRNELRFAEREGAFPPKSAGPGQAWQIVALGTIAALLVFVTAVAGRNW